MATKSSPKVVPFTYLKDTLQNLVSGMFTSKDKHSANTYFLSPLDAAQLEAAYRSDWIARKVIDVPPYDMTREWRDWQAEDDQIEPIEAQENALGVRLKTMKALTRARLFGGSVLVMGIEQGAPQEQLRVEALGKGSLKYIHVLNRHEVTAGEIVRDVMDPFFGEPRMWDIRSDKLGTIQVHPSRVIRFIGPELPNALSTQDCWGDSVLQALDDAVKNASLVSQTIASMTHEAKIDVIKVPQLMQNLATASYTARLTERFALANTLKSTMSLLLMDAEEEYERKEMNFAQLPDILRIYLQIAAGAADIPATRLLGQSPQGMNATGESDIRNYYDRIGADQELFLTPGLNRLDEVLIRSALGSRPEEIYYLWSPLWQMDEKQKAEIGKLRADTTKIYVDSGIVPADALGRAVVNQLIESGDYPGLEAAIEESEFEPEEFALRSIAKEEEAAELAKLQAKNNNVLPFKQKIAAGDAEPRTLYIRRDLKNVKQFIAWAKAQGFVTTLPAGEMHVTICYSKTPVDWMKVGEPWEDELKLVAGGPRLVEPLGPKGAIVLLFSSRSLAYRHSSVIYAGGSSDYEEYQPHITITYKKPEGLDLNKIEPYRGPIVLGPEIFEEIKDGTSEVEEV